MSVPALTLITPELSAEEIERRVRCALAYERSERIAVQLRARHLSDGERARVGGVLAELCRVRGAALIVNADLELARALDADGVQLPERGPSVEHAHAVLPPGRLIGASRHDAEGARAAALAGASFVLLAPVYDVPGKGPPLGIAGLRRIAAASTVPVIALGGIDQSRVAEVAAAGAAGIAVMREVFEAPDLALASSELLAALDAARSRAP